MSQLDNDVPTMTLDFINDIMGAVDMYAIEHLQFVKNASRAGNDDEHAQKIVNLTIYIDTLCILLRQTITDIIASNQSNPVDNLTPHFNVTAAGGGKRSKKYKGGAANPAMLRIIFICLFCALVQSSSMFDKFFKFVGITKPIGTELVPAHYYPQQDKPFIISKKPHDVDIVTQRQAGQTCTIGIDEQLVAILAGEGNDKQQQSQLSSVFEIKVSAGKSTSIIGSVIDIIGNFFSNEELAAVKNVIRTKYAQSQSDFANMFREICTNAFNGLSVDAEICFINLDEIVQLSYTDDNKLIVEFMFDDERTFNNQKNLISRLENLDQTKLANVLIKKRKLFENYDSVSLLAAKNMVEFMSSQNNELTMTLKPTFQAERVAQSISGWIDQLIPIIKSSSEGLSDVGVTALKPVISASGELSTYTLEKHAVPLITLITACMLFFMVYSLMRNNGNVSKEELIKLMLELDDRRKNCRPIANVPADQPAPAPAQNQLAIAPAARGGKRRTKRLRTSLRRNSKKKKCKKHRRRSRCATTKRARRRYSRK